MQDNMFFQKFLVIFCLTFFFGILNMPAGAIAVTVVGVLSLIME